MRIKLLLFCVTVLSVQKNWAQAPGLYFSGVTCTVQNKSDSAFLINNELKIWKAAKEGKVQMYDNPVLDIEFRTKMSKSAAESCFEDSFPSRSATSKYQMNLMANRTADTCYIMSFSPLLRYKYQQPGEWVMDSASQSLPATNSDGTPRILFSYGHREPGPWAEAVNIRFLIPISEYSKVLPKDDLARSNKYYKYQLSTLFEGKMTGDTIFRTVRFTCDSNEYLPQAPYRNLLTCMENFMLAGQVHAYKNENLQKPMTKIEIENTLVGWDSTNQVADPYNPGVFILAPLKTEGMPQSLLICEKWVSFTPPLPNYPYPYWHLQPQIGYRKEVRAYGLYLSNGNTIWFSPKELDPVLLQSNFDMKPYEECFRAERFQTLEIQVR